MCVVISLKVCHEEVRYFNERKNLEDINLREFYILIFLVCIWFTGIRFIHVETNSDPNRPILYINIYCILKHSRHNIKGDIWNDIARENFNFEWNTPHCYWEEINILVEQTKKLITHINKTSWIDLLCGISLPETRNEILVNFIK